MSRIKLIKLILYICVCFFLVYEGTSYSKVFKKPDQAIKDVFPGCTIEIKNIILTLDQLKMVEKLSGIPLKTRLVTFYVAKKEGRIIGYAYIDTHVVRTQLETILFTITPNGEIDIIEILSFNEPEEYLPEDGWLRLFKKKSIEKDPLRLRVDIPNVTGATLTAKAITESSRKVLALWKVIFRESR